MIELLKHASYSSSHDEDGGQILYLNKRLKRDIANKCGVSLTRVEHAITDFVKKEYMYRLDVGTYQFNANFFGKGSWVDIYKLRTIQAEFDFATGEVIANIVRNEEEEMNNATDEIASHSKTEIDKLKGA